MPCLSKALPGAAALIYMILSGSSLAAAAGIDSRLQFSNAVASRPAVKTPTIVPRQAQNVFVNPPGDPSDKDFSNNPVFEIDTVVDLQWTLDSTVTEELSLFLSVGINTSYAPEPQAIQSKST